MPFVESFVIKAFQEDLNIIINLPMFVNPHVVFAMLSFYCAQHLSYIFRIIFPFLNILQHYTKFDSRTMVMLEELSSAKSFNIMVGHLACHQIILSVSSRVWFTLNSFILLPLLSWDVGH